MVYGSLEVNAVRTQCNAIADFTYYQCWNQNLALKSISQTSTECPKRLRTVYIFHCLYLHAVHPLIQQKCQFSRRDISTIGIFWDIYQAIFLSLG